MLFDHGEDLIGLPRGIFDVIRRVPFEIRTRLINALPVVGDGHCLIQ